MYKVHKFQSSGVVNSAPTGVVNSVQLDEDQGIGVKLKKRVRIHVVVILATHMETFLNLPCL